jgi:acetylornithine deacetylase/succinyl-diaminopimelate desuccinylase-like protein
MKKKLQEYLIELSKIKSLSGKEEEKLRYLEENFKALGFDLEKQPVTDTTYNLIARKGKAKFAVCTHADHVKTKSGEEPLLKNGFFIGEGTADTTGQIAAVLFALQQTELPATVIITVDEEKEGKGSKSLKIDENLKGVLVLEPTSFVICSHQAGAIELKLQLKKDSYHASCSKPSENPILIAAKFLQKLEDFRRRSKFLRKWGLPTLTPIFIQSGDDDLFASPDELWLHLDLPVAPEEKPTKILSKVIELSRSFDFQISWAEVEPGFVFPSKSSILKTVEKAYEKTFKQKPVKGIMPSWTDAANIALSGIDTVVFGAGRLAYCHTPKEFVRIEDLEKLADFLVRFFEESAQ